MTALLGERAGKVVAVELDGRLVEKLQKQFAGDSRVQIVSADILQVNISALCRQEGIGFVFGNLPYYITSPILHRLFAHREALRAMGLVVQKEVAERLTALPGGRDYGYLSVLAQFHSSPQIVLSVPPGAFSPPPKVASTLVTFQMSPRFREWSQRTSEAFMEFVKRCFAHKRKRLLNNLDIAFPRGVVRQVLADAGHGEDTRGEELSLEEFANLFEQLHGPC